MSARNLDKIFAPRRIALIGVDGQPGIGLDVLRNIVGGGFEGSLYPVCPEREALLGIPTFPDLSALPRTPDLAVVCSPAARVAEVVDECGRADVGGVLILTSGFREQGEQGRLLEHRVAAAARLHPGMRIVGPNSLGIINPRLRLNASRSRTLPKPGNLAFISESRAVYGSVLDWAAEEGIAFSHIVSIGNRLDVGFGDLIDYLGADPRTRAIILYVQSIARARQFLSAARAFARAKPIVVFKAGRFAESARAAASHTGAMIAEDAVYEAAFERAGVVRVSNLYEVFDVAELLASQRLPRGPRLAILSNAGGPGVIAADALLGRGGMLAEIDAETARKLAAVLPDIDTATNPVQAWGEFSPDSIAEATRLLLDDKNVDGVLVIHAVQMGGDAAANARAIAQLAPTSSKPLLAAWMGGRQAGDAIKVLNEAGVPAHGTPESAVRAFMHLQAYAKNVETLYETPQDVRVSFRVAAADRRKKLREMLVDATGSLNEIQTKTLLDAYEIPVSETQAAHSAAEAVALAERKGYPVVLKVLSPQIVHKVDVGGVALNLHHADDVRDAYDRMLQTVGEHCPDADIHGVTVQRMVDRRQGLELILGAKKDPTFGAVIMVGLGGIATSIHHDRSLGLPPLNERLARRMLESLRFAPLLTGFRGLRAMNVDRLIEIMIRFSVLISESPEIRELDINPLLLTADDVLALDAVAILEGEEAPDSDADVQLAITPYPQHLVRETTLRNGTGVTLRPIRPEDEPAWHRLIAASSTESLRSRYRFIFKRATHEMAVDSCAIDYERDIAIVAEMERPDHRELIGVGQLVADLRDDEAEFAVLVPDAWQGQGLGGTLLDYCLELAARRGFKDVVAETDPANAPMLALFKRRGFESEVHYEDQVVLLRKHVGGNGS